MRTFRLLSIILLAASALALGLALDPVSSPSDLGYTSGSDAQTSDGPVLVGRADDSAATRVATSDDSADASASDDRAAPAPRDADDDEDAAFGSERMGMRLTVDHPLVAPVIAVQEKYTKDLMQRAGVVGTATGMNARGDICVLVLTKEDLTDLPAFLDGVPVEQFITGELFAGKKGGTPGPPGSGDGGGTSVDPTARFSRPVPIGVSTGHPAITAGTIGCRLVGGSGSLYALSNNHVYADQNAASIGDDVIQPGTYDGGSSPADDIGTLVAFVPLKFDGTANAVDAAIVSTTASFVQNSTPSDGYGTPKSATVSAAINDRVTKYGRTTGQTNGRVSGLNASLNVNYGGGNIGYFTGQIVIGGGSFSAGGDSGSYIVMQKGGDARKGVGLLFAGGSGATIANPIDAVLDAFSSYGVTVDGD